MTKTGRLLSWRKSPSTQQQLLDHVRWFAAGRSGIFAIGTDDILWYIGTTERWFSDGDRVKPVKIAENVLTASIGDSANYYVTKTGALHVKGLAHRGQYGDGKLQSTDIFIPVAKDVTSVKAHTGHALLLTTGGIVKGTGGNIYGPLSRHGIGDKATTWGTIFRDGVSIATGSSHSVSIRADRSLWIWGRDIGLDPIKVMENVMAVAADSGGSIALQNDGTLWQWDRDQRPKQLFRCPQ